MSRRRDIWRAVNGVIDRAGIAHTELARITAPTLVVVGDEDVATPPAKAQQIVGGDRWCTARVDSSRRPFLDSRGARGGHGRDRIVPELGEIALSGSPIGCR